MTQQELAEYYNLNVDKARRDEDGEKIANSIYILAVAVGDIAEAIWTLQETLKDKVKKTKK